MSTTPDLSRLRIAREARSTPSSGRSARGWIVGGILLVVLLIGWFLLQPRDVLVETATASATGGGTRTGSGITANGYVVARTKASVSAEVLGRLEYLPIAEGSVVRQGQVIARIESDSYRAALSAARARLAQLRVEADQAKRDLERAEKLFTQRVLADTEVESARTRQASLAAQVEAAQAQAQVAQAN